MLTVQQDSLVIGLFLVKVFFYNHIICQLSQFVSLIWKLYQIDRLLEESQYSYYLSCSITEIGFFCSFSNVWETWKRNYLKSNYIFNRLIWSNLKFLILSHILYWTKLISYWLESYTKPLLNHLTCFSANLWTQFSIEYLTYTNSWWKFTPSSLLFSVAIVLRFFIYFVIMWFFALFNFYIPSKYLEPTNNMREY